MHMRSLRSASLAAVITVIVAAFFLLARDLRSRSGPLESGDGPMGVPVSSGQGLSGIPAPGSVGTSPVATVPGQGTEVVRQAQRVSIAGLVALEDGADLPPKLTVELTTTPTCKQATQLAVHGGDGGFRALVELPPEAREVTLVAYAEGYVSVPFREAIRPSLHNVLLICRRAAIVRARAVDGYGVPVPNAIVHVLEVPDDRQRVIPTFELASMLLLDRVRVTDERGEIAAQVRPGTCALRLISADGVRGELHHGVAAEGGTLDLGDLPVPADGVPIQIQVLSEDGIAVPDAWVQLSDLTLQFGEPTALGFLPMFQTDAKGHTSLSPLAPSALPIRVAVGAPEFVVASCSVSAATPQPVEFRLARRFHFTVTVPPPSGMRADAFQALRAALAPRVVRVGPRQGAAPRAPRRRGEYKGPAPITEPEDRLREVLQASDVVWVPGGTLSFGVFTSGPGTFDVTLFPDTRSVTSQCRVERDGQQFDIPLMDGRLVQLHFSVPASWRSTAESLGAVEVSWAETSSEPRRTTLLSVRDATDGTAWWLPRSIEEVQLAAAHKLTLPFLPRTIQIPQDDSKHVDIALVDDPGGLPVTIALAGLSGRLQLADWPIWVVPGQLPSEPAPEERQGRIARTDTDGLLHLSLVAGRYRAIAVQRLGREVWTEFSVSPEGQMDRVIEIPLISK